MGYINTVLLYQLGELGPISCVSCDVNASGAAKNGQAPLYRYRLSAQAAQALQLFGVCHQAASGNSGAFIRENLL